jgi:hypothetical protein
MKSVSRKQTHFDSYQDKFMKLKLIALAATLVVAGAANAAPIDNGAAGNGGLFFNAWDGANSYTLNLGQTIDSFEALAANAAATPLNLSFAADALFTSYMSTANTAALKWNVQATDTLGNVRVLETFSAKPATGKTNDIIRTLSTGVQGFLTNAVNPSLATANDAVFALGTAGYAGGNAAIVGTPLTATFVQQGTVANSSFASGLGLLRINALSTGTAVSTYTPYVQNGVSVSAYLAADNSFNLTVAAVPEAESYAMLLAGLGLIGSIARRRNKYVA